MNEKSAKATETVEIDPGMSVMPGEPGPMDVPTAIPELDTTLAAMSSALPAYQTTAWKNKPSTETPVDAAVMTRVEQRLVDLTNAVNALRDSVSRICGEVEVQGYDVDQRIGIQMKSKASNRRCVFGLTSDNHLYINSQNESGAWNDARYI